MYLIPTGRQNDFPPIQLHAEQYLFSIRPTIRTMASFPANFEFSQVDPVLVMRGDRKSQVEVKTVTSLPVDDFFDCFLNRYLAVVI